MRQILTSKWTKVLVFLVCLGPVFSLAFKALTGGLGANPVEYIQLSTGEWTLRFLAFTLSVTPMRKLLNLADLIRFRRMLGLFAFFYVCLHFLTYLGPDQSFDLSAMWKDVYKRPFITVGFLGLLLLLPLALTSTAGWIRRLGGKNWQRLHRLIYLAAIAGVIHYTWKVKSDFRAPAFYAVVFTILLLWRFFDWLSRKRSKAPARATVPAA